MHLDSTFRGWSATLAAGVRLVVARLVLVLAIPLDFYGRLRVIRSMFIPDALHSIEASSLANAGAVLGLLDGPSGCDPAFCVVWFRFRMLRGFLAYRPGEVSKVYRLLEHVAGGCPGHGPVHLLVGSAAEIGFVWSPEMVGWAREGLPVLSSLSDPIQHFRAAFLEGWRSEVSADLCAREGFRGGPWLDVDVSLQLLNSGHVREGDKALLRRILVGGVWNGFLLHKVKGQRVTCRFCGGDDGDGHLFWECPFPPLVEIREHPEFHDLVDLEKSSWPRCLLWHGWLPLHSGVNGGSSWAGSPREGASNLLECAFGRYSSDALTEWQLPVGFDAEGAARRVAAEPDVLTDGSSVEDELSGASSAGAGCFTFVAVVFGRIGCGVIWLKMLDMMHLLVPVVVFVLLLVRCSLFKGLSFGVLFLLCRLMMVCILGLTILVLYGMLAASWMAGLLLVLLSWLGWGSYSAY